MLNQLWHKLKRRPVRIMEAVIALVAAFGLTLAPDVQEAVIVLVVALVGVVGGEVAQTRTTPIDDPEIPDGHEDEGHPDYTP